jgi:hypothetical protein
MCTMGQERCKKVVRAFRTTLAMLVGVRNQCYKGLDGGEEEDRTPDLCIAKTSDRPQKPAFMRVSSVF